MWIRIYWSINFKEVKGIKKLENKCKSILKKLREDKSINQSELARKVGVNRTTICRIENGTRSPSLGVAYRIAKELDVPVEKIFEWEDYIDRI